LDIVSKIRHCQENNERHIFAIEIDSPFKGEKEGFLKSKSILDFIQSNTSMVVKKTFEILKGRWRILLKIEIYQIWL